MGAAGAEVGVFFSFWMIPLMLSWADGRIMLGFLDVGQMMNGHWIVLRILHSSMDIRLIRSHYLIKQSDTDGSVIFNFCSIHIIHIVKMILLSIYQDGSEKFNLCSLHI